MLGVQPCCWAVIKQQYVLLWPGCGWQADGVAGPRGRHIHPGGAAEHGAHALWCDLLRTPWYLQTCIERQISAAERVFLSVFCFEIGLMS